MHRHKLPCTLVLIAIVGLVLISCASQEQIVDNSRTSSIFQRGEVKNCKITAETADVKASPGHNSRTISTLDQGEVVNVLGKISNWYVVKLNQRQIGCVDTAEATPVVKEGQGPQKPLPTQHPPREQAPATEVEPISSPSSMEQKMLNLINDERQRRGLGAYNLDRELARVTRIKAEDMVEEDYFSHYSPTYGSPFDMMDHFGIEYLRAGENIAANRSVDNAHSSLMESTGHRQNILNDNFSHIGIGIQPSEKYGYIFVQMFISKPH